MRAFANDLLQAAIMAVLIGGPIFYYFWIVTPW